MDISMESAPGDKIRLFRTMHPWEQKGSGIIEHVGLNMLG